MAKELPFFKFDISEWMFGRIQKQPDDVQGMFINLCCKYWHKLGEYLYEDASLDFGERLDGLIKNKLIDKKDGYIIIKFLDTQLDECAASSEKQRIKGLKSAKLRAERKLQATTVEPRLTIVQPNPTEEKRREENRGEYPVEISDDWTSWGNQILKGEDHGWEAMRGRKITSAELDTFLSVAVRCNWKISTQQQFRISLKGFKAKDHQQLTTNGADAVYKKGRAFGEGQ